MKEKKNKTQLGCCRVGFTFCTLSEYQMNIEYCETRAGSQYSSNTCSPFFCAVLHCTALSSHALHRTALCSPALHCEWYQPGEHSSAESLSHCKSEQSQSQLKWQLRFGGGDVHCTSVLLASTVLSNGLNLGTSRMCCSWIILVLVMML